MDRSELDTRDGSRGVAGFCVGRGLTVGLAVGRGFTVGFAVGRGGVVRGVAVAPLRFTLAISFQPLPDRFCHCPSSVRL